MAKTYIFDNKQISIPGVYTRITADVETPSVALAAGNCLIIDTGLDSNYTGGSGSVGEFNSGKDSLSIFTSSRSFGNYVGGPLARLAEPIFAPAGSNAGATSLRYINAATTVAASISYTLVQDGTSDPIGSLTIKPLKEGLAANGVLDGSKLVRGFSAKFSAGTVNTDAVVLSLYQGGYKGTESALSSEGGDVSGVSQADSVEKLIARSPEFTTIQQIISWCQTDGNFNQNFKLTASTATGTTITADDIAGQLTHSLAAGGTTTYSTDSLDAALDAVADENIDFVLLLDSGSEGYSTDNIRIFNFFAQESKIQPTIVVGGYTTSATLRGASASSNALAKSYDSEQVVLVHGGIYLSDAVNPSRNKEYNSLMSAAYYVGRSSGLAPQVPGTNKNIGIKGLTHTPVKIDKEYAIANGILMFHRDGDSFDILKDISTLQNNDNLVNPDATTYACSIFRIKRQINKELEADLKQTFLKNPVGSNQYTTSAEAVSTRVEKFLGDREVTSTSDNLLLSFGDIVTRVESDAIFVDYRIVVNGPIDLIFATGIIVN